MALEVFRCMQCRREVLVQLRRPLTETDIARMRDQEMRPASPGRRGALSGSERMRDDIWLGISSNRTPIPRERVPERCPACGHDGLKAARILE